MKEGGDGVRGGGGGRRGERREREEKGGREREVFRQFSDCILSCPPLQLMSLWYCY